MWRIKNEEMTKREAKIEALRTCTALINAGVYWDNKTEEEVEKIDEAMREIAESLRKRAVKLGGEFNQYTGNE